MTTKPQSILELETMVIDKLYDVYRKHRRPRTATHDILQAFAQFLKSIELPEKRLAPGDIKTVSENGSFYFKCKGYDEALDDCQKIFDELIGGLK